MRIAVCAPQVPFVRGGAELMADDLVDGAARARARRRARHDPVQVVPRHARARPGVPLAARRPDRVRRAADRPRDRDEVPGVLRPPPNKVAWVLHQFRQAYDYDRTELGQFSESPEDRATRRAVERLDGVALGEARNVFATSRNVADRLQRFNGIEAEVLPHPPQALAYRSAEPEGFVLSVNRLDRAKRIDLLIEAAARSRRCAS